MNIFVNHRSGHLESFNDQRFAEAQIYVTSNVDDIGIITCSKTVGYEVLGPSADQIIMPSKNYRAEEFLTKSLDEIFADVFSDQVK